jgi:exopolyphosphatase/guanosine-5'-triphosphate,3'-diphosphate pyrophosphatase
MFSVFAIFCWLKAGRKLILQSKNYAAVDIGTNSFHLIIAKVNQDDSLTIIDKEREVIRLGSHKGEGLSVISPDEIEKGISVLKRFKRLSDNYKAEVRAVATSAIREAQNGNEFVEKVLEKTGIDIEIIDGRTEAGYIYKGVKKTVPFKDKRLLCIDIGGGSTEIILGHNDEIIFGESIKIGAVRLSKKFFPDFILTDEGIADCNKFIERQIKVNQQIDFREKFDIAVGASGTILAVAGMIKYRKSAKKIKSRNGYTFTKIELEEVTNGILKRKTPEQRVNIEGMEYKRADIIPAGLLILDKIFELFKIKKMVISEFALREGVVLSMLEREQSLQLSSNL